LIAALYVGKCIAKWCHTVTGCSYASLCSSVVSSRAARLLSWCVRRRRLKSEDVMALRRTGRRECGAAASRAPPRRAYSRSAAWTWHPPASCLSQTTVRLKALFGLADVQWMGLHRYPWANEHGAANNPLMLRASRLRGGAGCSLALTPCMSL